MKTALFIRGQGEGEEMAPPPFAWPPPSKVPLLARMWGVRCWRLVGRYEAPRAVELGDWQARVLECINLPCRRAGGTLWIFADVHACGSSRALAKGCRIHQMLEVVGIPVGSVQLRVTRAG